MKVLIEYTDSKTKRWRKSKVVIHSKDLWSGDVTLAHIIHPMLVKYRNLYNEPNPMKGIPASMFDEFPVYVSSDDNPEEDAAYKLKEEQATAKWLNTLDTMIYAFKWIKDDSTFGPHGKDIHAELDALRKEYKKAQKEEREEQIGDNFYTLDKSLDVWAPVFEKYRSELDAHEDKIKEGLRLFGEHFQSLWT